MKQNQLLLFLTSALVLLVSACSQPEDLTSPTLDAQYGTSLNDIGSFVTSNEAGHLYTIGTICGMFCEEDYGEPVLKRFDTLGKELWSHKLGVQCNENIYRCVSLDYGLSVDPNGNSYALFGRVYTDTSTEGEPTRYDSTLKKFDSNGTLLWTQPVFIGNRGQRQAGAVTATTSTGNTFVAYEFLEYDPLQDLYTISSHLVKYSSNGKKIFDKPHVIDDPSGAAVAGDGTLYIVGNGKVAKYRNDGTFLWQRTLPVVSQYDAAQVTVNDAKVYVATNTSTNEAENRIALYRYSTSGTPVWRRTITSSSKEITLTGLSADASGNAYLVGNIRDPYTPGGELRTSDFFSRKYTSSGSVAWTYAPELPNTNEFVNDVSAADSGKVYLVGTTTGKVNGVNNGGRDAFLIRLSPEGKKVWSR